MVINKKIGAETVITLRKSEERGTADRSWLDSRHTFYGQKSFPEEEKKNRFRLIASPDGRDGSITIHQDAGLYATLLDPGKTATQLLSTDRHAWLQVASGVIQVGGRILRSGDAAAISSEISVSVEAQEPAELLLFDLA